MAGFDPFGDWERNLARIWKWGKIGGKIGYNVGQEMTLRSFRQDVEKQFGPVVADAVIAAMRAGRDAVPIIEQAKRDRAARQEREKLLANPPTIYGSARWPTSAELDKLLRGDNAFNSPRSVILGDFHNEGERQSSGTIHWEGDGHLLTIAPTRSGKSRTTIVTNLLRYRGSCVVLDPKGELFEATSKWRSTVGPVYRLAPFDKDGRKLTHRFDPVSRVSRESDARSIAMQMFPRDPKSPAFFTDDAVGIVTGFIMFVRYKAPPHRQSLATVCQLAMLKGDRLLDVARQMAAFPPSADAGNAILAKDVQRSLKVLQETLTSKLYEWRDADIQNSVSAGDFTFESLKDAPATVYIEMPFDMMKTYSGWLRVALKTALDAMLANTKVPHIPVLFVLDEFLNIGPFPEYRDAIRTHAGAGVRLWFFLQDIYSIQEHYPGDSWRPFLNCAVKQFFGINDDDTAKLIGGYLGHKTHAIRNTTSTTNVSSNLANWDQSSANSSFSTNESVQFLGRPLMTSNEVRELLGGWQEGGWRYSITDIAGYRPFQTRLAVYDRNETCVRRLGMAPAAGVA